MIKCLKDRYIYSPKDIRDLFFRAFNEISPSLATEPLKAGAIAVAALNKAKEMALVEGIEYTYWPAAADAILEMMLAAGALERADGTTLKPSAHARAEKVSVIAPDFENRCEMFLLEFLVGKLGNVTVRDRTSLAHALLKVSPKEKQVFELQERVDELLLLLRDRMSEGQDGRLVIDHPIQTTLSSGGRVA
jgi:hypothetical protein